MNYSVSLQNVLTSVQNTIPSQIDYSQFCSNMVVNRVYPYEQYWDVSVCGRITSPADIDKIKTGLLQIWMSKHPEINRACQCLNVEVLTALTQHFTIASGQQVSRLFYLVYANSLTRILERGVVTDPARIPSAQELSLSLKANGFESCQSQNVNVTFSVTLCGPLSKPNMMNILNGLRSSWQSDYDLGGGIGKSSQVAIIYQNHSEFSSNTS
jgi:hypothetical protein